MPSFLSCFRAFAIVCAGVALAPAAVAGEWDPPDDGEDAPPSPPPSTTVVAPPGPGVTVVAPTAQGGTVTATGCTSVVVEGAPTVVQPCPAYRPYEPAPRIVYVDRPVGRRFARDPGRTAGIAVGAVGQAVGSLLAGAWYGDSLRECRRYSSSDCQNDPAIPQLVTYASVMILAPGLPRLIIGDIKGFTWFSVGIGAAITLGKIADESDEDRGIGTGGVLFGYVAAASIGIVELATTPHREDLRKDGPSIDSVTPIPLADARGTHGAALTLAGRF
jgi:hypothetical protein